MDDEVAFAIYFGQVMGIQYHPSNPASKRMSVRDCAAVALEMLGAHRVFFPKEDKSCQLVPQQL